MNIFINNRYRKIYNIDKTLFYVIYKKEKVNITEYFKKNGVIKKKYNYLIQKKSKMFGGTDNTLVVCSLNVYTWEGYSKITWEFDDETKRYIKKTGHANFDTKFKKLISEEKLELLLTQEDNIKDNDNNESVKAYSIGEEGVEQDRFKFISCSKTSPQLKGAIRRNAIIIEDTKFGIKIANVHLEGGRFIDLELDNTTFQQYLDSKLELLKELLKSAPDIIAGDFNSVYCNDPILRQKMCQDQKNYYDSNSRSFSLQPNDYTYEGKKDDNNFLSHISKTYKLQLIQRCPNNDSESPSSVKELSSSEKVLSSSVKVLSLENIVSWNYEPFKLLLANKYIYIEPENIVVNDKINPTNSKGQNIIDHVWVKESICDIFDFNTKIYDDFGKAVDDLYGGVSDHKPIILTITKKEKARLAEEEKARLAEEEKARLDEEEKARLAEEQKARLAKEQKARLAEEEKAEKVAVKKSGYKSSRTTKRKRTGAT